MTNTETGIGATESTSAWFYLCKTSDITDADTLRVEVAGRSAIAVFRANDEYWATDDTCTHGAASLSDGLLVGFEIECPFHDGRFDIRTGAATKRPCQIALTAYDVRIDGDALYARAR
jgi:nitrite reductase/ring-hydroxylating ferredoxin subunit